MGQRNHSYPAHEVVVSRAREFAINAHWGQMYGTKPYLHHLEEVASICDYFDLPDYVKAAAYLHDVVEDTDITADQVCAEFNYEVATLVYSVTDEAGENRKERKAKTYRKILAHPYGVYLKLADRIANVKACSTAKDTGMFKMYCKEAGGFEKELKRPGIAEDMWAELDKLYGKDKQSERE